MKTRNHRGFTLIELLTIIAIIAVLIGLLLPAVQQARDAARRAQCQSNLKQIGLACHNYESANGKLPPVNDWEGVGKYSPPSFNWVVQILPFIEQDNIFRKGGYDTTWGGAPNGPHVFTATPTSPYSASKVLTMVTDGTSANPPIVEKHYPPWDLAQRNLQNTGWNVTSRIVGAANLNTPADGVQGAKKTVATPGWNQTIWDCYTFLAHGNADSGLGKVILAGSKQDQQTQAPVRTVALSYQNNADASTLTYGDLLNGDEFAIARALAGPLSLRSVAPDAEIKAILADFKSQLRTMLQTAPGEDPIESLSVPLSAITGNAASFLGTYASFCEMVKEPPAPAPPPPPALAERLCQYLSDAEAAERRGDLAGKAAALKLYRDAVQAERGKAYTAEYADMLFRLSFGL